MRRPSPRRDGGFTLVELLIVIVIVGILVALLIPAIAGAVKNAQNARVTADINNMAAALEAFKTKYGDYPPSRVVLSESGAYPTSDTTLLSAYGNFAQGGGATGGLPAYTFGSPDLTIGALAQRSVQYLRKFWPKAAPPNATSWHDFNGNGALDPGLIYLEGDECLVFFLGGIPSPTSTGFGMSGFDRNPVHPFTTSLLTAGANMSSENRAAPFFEFQGGRLIDFDNDGIPSYIDTLNSGPTARPFAYFSAYGNTRYDPNDMNWPEDDPSSLVGRSFNVSGLSAITASAAPNPYTSAAPGMAAARDRFLNGTSFQIISAGADGLYGVGGTYNTGSNGDTLPLDGLTPSDIRTREQDNLTNFSASKLD
jgi:general secretion pathway protein G